MAKQQAAGSDPGEVVIFYARARGGGAVVAESVRALAEAVERTAQPRVTARVVQRTLPAKGDEKTLFDPVEEAAEPEAAEPLEEVVDAAPSTANQRQKRGQGPKV